MAKSKQSTTNQKKQEITISEQQRNNHPIFKTVYKRIRNLNKKLANIDALMELDKTTLKPEQLDKIAGRKDVEAQIKKTQQFAFMYKSLIDESGASTSDNREDILKIATLLVVGQHLDRSKHSVDKNIQTVYSESYKKLWISASNTESLQNQIRDISQLLNSYLKNQNSYSALKLYTPSQQIEQDVQEKLEIKQQQKNQEVKVESSKVEEPVRCQEQPKKQQRKGVEEPEQTKPSKTGKISQPAPAISAKIETPVPEPQEQTTAANETKPQAENIQNPESNNLKQSADQNSEKVEQKPKKEQTGRGYNKNYRAYNNGTRYYQNQNKINGERENPRNYQQKQKTYANGDGRYKNQYKAKAENARNYDKPKRNHARKDSDTSLEPTPEKNKVVQKPKYIQKD